MFNHPIRIALTYAAQLLAFSYGYYAASMPTVVNVSAGFAMMIFAIGIHEYDRD